MTQTPVRSSDLQSIGYDEATCTLEIKFHSGGVYQYSRVSPSVYQGLMGAIFMRTSKTITPIEE